MAWHRGVSSARPPALPSPAPGTGKGPGHHQEGSPERRQLNEVDPVGDGGIPFHKDSAAVLARPYPTLPSAAVGLSPTRIAPSSRSHTRLGQGSWTRAGIGSPAGHPVAPWLLQPGSMCCWSRASSCAPAQGSPRHQHFGSQSHPQPGLGLLLRAEQTPVLPHGLPSFPAQQPYAACLCPAGAALPHFQPNCQLYNPLPGCCETPLGGEGSGGQAGQRSLCSGAAQGNPWGRFHPVCGLQPGWDLALPAASALPGWGAQPPTGPLLPPWLAWAGGSSDPISFQFSLKPLERHHPHKLVRLGLPALTLSVPVQSELSIFVVQYLYTLLKCFMRFPAAVTKPALW